MNRRKFVQTATVTSTVVTAISVPGLQAKEQKATRKKRYQNGATHWPICLDTATLSKELTLEEKVKLAADAGFDAIEPWDRELQKHEESGGSLKDLGKEIRDRGLYVPSVIGLWGGLAPSKEIFNQEIDVHKKRLQMISDIGSEHVQVIPKFGREEPLDKRVAAWSYSQVCEMAKEYNLKPAAIFLNMVRGLERMSDATAIALDSDQPEAMIIPDTYHMFLAGTGPNALGRLRGDFIAIFQFADAGKEVEPILHKGVDSQRVLPGDGKIDLKGYLTNLKKTGFDGCISLELYNPEYRKREPVAFLEEALRKTVKVVSSAG